MKQIRYSMKHPRTFKLMSKIEPKKLMTFRFGKAKDPFHDYCPYCKSKAVLYILEATRKDRLVSGNSVSHLIGRGENFSPYFCNTCINEAIENTATFHFKTIMGLL